MKLLLLNKKDNKRYSSLNKGDSKKPLPSKGDNKKLLKTKGGRK